MRKLKNNELKRITIDEFKSSKKKPVVIVLDNIRSAHNVGSIFRTSDAFLITKLILCGITPTPPSNEIRKSALGSTNSVEWVKEEETGIAINQLKKEGYYIVGVEQVEEATEIQKFQNNKPIALIFGHEVNGISQEIIDTCDEIIEIPQYGTKHSLNISVCAGIVMWKIAEMY
ncbi:MAG: RNA methyltransferase [Flavobacteriales bacterium]|jgi:23S rRNA (guanosine2251-2'-O)-methyltransferase|nr:RNA methyltransferase [Flavobacteriales bacterium]